MQLQPAALRWAHVRGLTRRSECPSVTRQQLQEQEELRAVWRREALLNASDSFGEFKVSSRMPEL